MATRLVYTGRAIENSATVVLGRVTDIEGNPIQSDDIQSLTLRVFNKSTGALVVPDGEDADEYEGTELDPASVVLDSPEISDVRWPYGDPDDIEGTGYNLPIDLRGSYLPEGNVTFRVEVYVVPADDEYLDIEGLPYYLLWELTTEAVYSE